MNGRVILKGLVVGAAVAASIYICKKVLESYEENETEEPSSENPKAEKLLVEEQLSKLKENKCRVEARPTSSPTNSLSKNEETVVSTKYKRTTTKFVITDQDNSETREIIVRTKRNQFSESDRYDQTNQVSSPQETPKVPWMKPEYNVCNVVAKPFEYQRQLAESNNASLTQPEPSRVRTRSAGSRLGLMPLKAIRTTTTDLQSPHVASPSSTSTRKRTSSAAPSITSKPGNNLTSNSCNPVVKRKTQADQTMKQSKREAWVTLATNDSYGMGALVVGASLKKSQTTKEIHCMITAEVGDEMGRSLYSVFDHVSMVDELNSNDSENLTLQGRPELGITLTKLNCWKLTQYTKCVFLDADTLVLSNCDELFLHEEFSAVADTGWPDIFNSGVFVFTPSRETYRGLIQCAINAGSFDGGDQGMLNTYFHSWRDQGPSYRLSFIYNCPAISNYTYASAYKKFGKDVKIVHFLGDNKPWNHTNDGARTQPLLNYHIAQWWLVYSEMIQPNVHKKRLIPAPYKCLSPAPHKNEGKEGDPIPSTARESPGTNMEDEKHRLQWEAGLADYLGKDSFDKIQKKLDDKLNDF